MLFHRLRRMSDRWRRDAYDERPVGGGFHLWWQGLAATRQPIVACEVTFEVLREPTVPALYFWAIQASFRDPQGAHLGAAHLGLQWNARHPDHRAVNWGGYAQVSDVTSILEGTDSPLASTPNDPNTRDFPWRVGVPYRLAIRHGERGWEGSITDTDLGSTIVVRELLAGGDRLSDVVMWSELFCRGSDPPSDVRWSDPAVITAAGEVIEPTGLRAMYPGGPEWRRLDTSVDRVGVVQSTDRRRSLRHGSTIPVRAGSSDG